MPTRLPSSSPKWSRHDAARRSLRLAPGDAGRGDRTRQEHRRVQAAIQRGPASPTVRAAIPTGTGRWRGLASPVESASGRWSPGSVWTWWSGRHRRSLRTPCRPSSPSGSPTFRRAERRLVAAGAPRLGALRATDRRRPGGGDNDLKLLRWRRNLASARVREPSTTPILTPVPRSQPNACTRR